MIDKSHIIQKNYQKIICCIVSFYPIILEYDSQSKKIGQIFTQILLVGWLYGFVASCSLLEWVNRAKLRQGRLSLGS